MKITYFVSLEKRNQQIFVVRMLIEEITDHFITVVMPAWIPGSYRIRDFAGRIRYLRASDPNGTALRAQKTDKSSWKVYNGDSGSVQISYEVFSGEVTPRTSFVDHRHALINGASLFLYVDGYIEQTSEIVIDLPDQWKITNGLEKIAENRFRSINYDILVDSPILAGDQSVISFRVDGKEHELAVSGNMAGDMKAFASDLEKVCSAASFMMGGIPARRYCFILEMNSSGGGLEHMNSTVIMADRLALTDTEKYKKLLKTFAHEYFHMWNVKRIRPAELSPLNYRSENYTGLLWIAEGFTDYFARKFLARSGIFSRDEFIRDISDLISMFMESPGRHMQSAYDSSFDSWIKQYQPSPDSVNSSISYYTLGDVLALCLDISIVRATSGHKSLDDFMRLLFDRYRKDGRGYSEKDILAGLKEISGIDFTEFFDRHVHGTAEIDFGQLLSSIGLKLSITPGREGFTGLLINRDNGVFRIAGKLENTPAWESPLVAGDEIVAVGGIKFTDLFTGRRYGYGPALHDAIGRVFSGRIEIAFFHQNVLYTCSYNAVPAGTSYRVEKEPTGEKEIPAESEKFLEKIIGG